MEIDKIDTSSPNGVLEDYLRSQESETVSSKSNSSDSDDAHRNPKHPSRWQIFVKSSVLNISRRWSRISIKESAFVDVDQWKKIFTLSELQFATNNFSHDNLVGKGGYAEVYKGCFGNGKNAAVKRLIKGKLEDRIGDFLSEIGIMAHVNHPNTTKLIGYGVEGGMHLVLELSPHGSLASLLHGSKEKLEWRIRYKIALGTAEGLLYLHQGCKRRIIHRDIKAANILLNRDFEPQICDFGLAKWLPENCTHHVVSKFEGTFGYLAPEYLMHGIVDEKTDVFAFGVLLLELITGRRALDYSQQSLVMWAKPLLYKNKTRELVDPSLAGDYDPLQMNLMLLTASLCIKRSSDRRPLTNQVLQILKGNLGCLEGMRIRRMAFLRKVFHHELFDTVEHMLGGDRNHLNLHNLALEV